MVKTEFPGLNVEDQKQSFFDVFGVEFKFATLDDCEIIWLSILKIFLFIFVPFEGPEDPGIDACQARRREEGNTET